MNIGDKAPEILGRDQNGNEIKLSDFAGRKLVLYFYPKDSTSGCTAEACSLRDNYSELRRQGYEVVGVSIQDEKSHQKFIEKNQLPFNLIADTDMTLVQQMGVWGEGEGDGRKYLGTLHHNIYNRRDIPNQKKNKTKVHAEQILEVREHNK